MTQCFLALFGSLCSDFTFWSCLHTFSECVKKSFSCCSCCCCCTFWNSRAGCFCCFWPAVTHSQSPGPVTSPDSRHHQWSTIKTPPCRWEANSFKMSYHWNEAVRTILSSHQLRQWYKMAAQTDVEICRMYTTTQRLRKVGPQNVCCSTLDLFNWTNRVT